MLPSTAHSRSASATQSLLRPPPYSAFELRTLYLQEMFVRGILIIGSHNMSYAHSDDDVDALLAAYDEVLPILRAAIDRGDLLDRLHCEPLKPLFKVR